MPSKHYVRHGLDHTPVYNSWSLMKGRCTNPNNPKYKDYGGRGITYCKEWEYFINFYNDMGDKPEGLTIDRIDNDKGYYKNNCRWATPREQSENRRSTGVVPGVTWNKYSNKWRARGPTINGKAEHLGMFTKHSDAVYAKKLWEVRDETSRR